MPTRNRKFFRPTFLVLVLVGLLLLGHYTQRLTILEDATRFAFQPVGSWMNRQAISLQSWFGASRHSITELQKQNQELQTQLNTAVIDASQLASIKAENEVLRQTLNFVRNQPVQYQVANIVARASDQLSHSFTIDRGSADGLYLGSAVTDRGSLVGKIVSLTDHSSQVRAVTDIRSVYSVKVNNQQNSIGLLQGQHQVSLQLELIPQLEKIEVGQHVFTSGIDDGLPADLLLGTISQITTATSDLFQTAAVTPAVDVDTLTIVAVVTR